MFAAAQSAGAQEPFSVAVVDDDPMWRFLLASALRERGWQVFDFESGPRMLDELAARAFDIVLVDAMMPEVDGFETCRRVRRSEWAATPLLMLTGLEDDHSIRRAFDAGANDFFIKSTHWPLLVERIRSLVDAAETERRLRHAERDLDAGRDARRELEQLAEHDPLTRLPNRDAFLRRLAVATNEARACDQCLAVALIDIDRFRQINDTLGQAAGDQVLRMVGERIVAALREALGVDALGAQGNAGRSHACAARFPGDEFALAIPSMRSVSEVDETLRHVRAALHRPFVVDGSECFVSTSVGVAMFPRDGDSPDALISNADRATREVKARGRNDVGWYRPTHQEENRDRFEILSGLHKAIERAEFEVYFQPWVDLASATVTGVEALLRWRRGDRQIPPAEFIPVAEDSGLIIPIGEWVLQHAAGQFAQMRRQGIALQRLAVNIPTAHFERDTLLSGLRAALHLNSLPPRSIELELTETCMVRDFEKTLPKLEALIRAGATLAIDDFGTGYSSLAYLTRLPISKLKVDRAFVGELGRCAQGAAVCKAIIALGQGLGVQVLAEGVETAEQARELMALGCTTMQGFLFARPVPAAALSSAISEAVIVARHIIGGAGAAGRARHERNTTDARGEVVR
ncbi:MAG: EAL domain-containing protein [Burkholderiaceae bacterium]|nr:EAL domain-containing protein [Burkholderiaceae bacterium]